MFIVEILSATFFLFIEMAPYLILGLIFVGLLNLFITKDLIAGHIGKNDFWSVFKAALFGIPLPLCSCGVVPSSVYMANNGASKPAVVSFLTATPQTGIDSILATYGMMGPVIAVFRPFAALIMGIAGGIAARFTSPTLQETKPKINLSLDSYQMSSVEKKNFKYYYKRLAVYPFVEFLDDISSQFIIGLFIAGLITFLIPENFFSGSIISNGLPGMIVLILISIPMYVCATASIPIAVSLMLKGFSPGVAFVFLAAGPATNIASLSIIATALGKKTTAVYVGMIAIMSIVFGLILDLIFSLLEIDPLSQLAPVHSHEMNHVGVFQWIISGIFLILLMLSVYRKFIKPKIGSRSVPDSMKDEYIIEGMTCNHCVMNVEKAIKSISGVTEVSVDLTKNTAYVAGDFNQQELINNVEEIGYKVKNDR